MKRSLFDSDYDKIRKDAGLARPRYEIEEPDANGQKSSERVAAGADDFRERMAALSAQEAKRKAEAEAEATRRSLETTRSLILREYQQLGLTPPSDRPPSLSLLLSIGWRVEQITFMGETKFELIRPAWMPRPAQKVANGGTESDDQAGMGDAVAPEGGDVREGRGGGGVPGFGEGPLEGLGDEEPQPGGADGQERAARDG